LLSGVERRETRESTGLAESESFNFFHERDEDWKRAKSIILAQRSRESGAFLGAINGPTFFQTHGEPEHSCQFEKRIGSVGDGGKWVCDPHRITKGNCIVYSIGGSNEWSFEEAMYNETGCETHTFDYTLQQVVGKPSFVNFHAIGLGDFNKSNNPDNLKTLPEIIESLGHQSRTIDVLKVDCEGCEFAALTPLFRSKTELNVRQILIEIHAFNAEAINRSYDLLKAMGDYGFVIFHKEPNIQFGGGVCTEFSLIRLNIPELKK